MHGAEPRGLYPQFLPFLAQLAGTSRGNSVTHREVHARVVLLNRAANGRARTHTSSTRATTDGIIVVVAMAGMPQSAATGELALQDPGSVLCQTLRRGPRNEALAAVQRLLYSGRRLLTVAAFFSGGERTQL